jgi:hypothetical protein
MNNDALSAIAALLLAISLSTERLVTVVKTLIPWLGKEAKTAAGEEDLKGDMGRRLILQVIAFLSAWVTAGLIAGTLPNSLFEELTMSGIGLPTVVIGLLASGGSALWTNVVTVASTTKDIKKTVKAAESLKFQERALLMGRTPEDSGVALRSGTTVGPRQPDPDIEL